MTLDPTMLLYTYISRFSVTPHYIKSGRVAATNAVPQPFLIAISTSRTNGPRLLSRVKMGTHSPLPTGSHTAAHTAKHGAFRMGALLLPSERFTRFGNPAWPGVRTANFAPFGSWSGGPLEERREPAEQRCAYARRCSKASRPRWAA